jgi:hypothetical protein
MKNALIWAAAIAALACTTSLRAHHSVSVIETSKPFWLKGTVSSYEPKNPHVMITLEGAKGDDGKVETWTVEGPILSRLARMNLAADFLKPGDVIEVCGFEFKEQYRSPERPLFIHGHVLVLPDGRKQTWGPYGKLDNCIRPDDEPQAWLDFLGADPLAPALWCAGQGYLGNVPSVAPSAIVDEINRRLTPPCGH